MLFEIYTEKGRRLFYTSSEECIPDKDILNSMSKAGYKFKLNGKQISLKNLEKQIRENI